MVHYRPETYLKTYHTRASPVSTSVFRASTMLGNADCKALKEKQEA
jgi:hypothetical protein